MVQVNRRSGIETKAKIFDAAMRVFSAYGYSGASIRAIAKAAGISIGGVYLYFRNKQELYLDLIKSRIEEQDHTIKKSIASAGSSTDALNVFLSLHIEFGIKNKELILINIREHGFGFALEIKRKFLRTQIRLLVNILSEGTRDREFRKFNTEEAARIIMATLRGIVHSMVIEGESVITEKGLADFILKGLVKTAKVKKSRKNLRKREEIEQGAISKPGKYQ
jgi:AcrR family transcriptional regulator